MIRALITIASFALVTSLTKPIVTGDKESLMAQQKTHGDLNEIDSWSVHAAGDAEYEAAENKAAQKDKSEKENEAQEEEDEEVGDEDESTENDEESMVLVWPQGGSKVKCVEGPYVENISQAECHHLAIYNHHSFYQYREDKRRCATGVTCNETIPGKMWNIFRVAEQSTHGEHMEQTEDVERTEEINRSPTFAVISRVWLGELPYLSSFIRHYEGLGVDHVYLLFLNCSEKQAFRSYLRQHLPGRDRFVDLIDDGCVKLDHIKAEFNIDAKKLPVKEDFLLAIDTDEYLRVSPEKIWRANPRADAYRLEWIMAPYDGLGTLHAPPYPVWNSRSMGKQMVRFNSLKRLSTHNHILTCGKTYLHGDCQVENHPHTLVHFHYRGVMDAAIKDASGTMKGRGVEDLVGRCEEGEPAKQAKALAFSMTVAEKPASFWPGWASKIIPSSFMGNSWMPTLTIDKDAEAEVITQIGLSPYVARIEALYKKFRDALQQFDWQDLKNLSSRKRILEIDKILDNVTLNNLRDENTVKGFQAKLNAMRARPHI